MRFAAFFCITLLLISSLGCASRSPLPSGEPETVSSPPADAYLSAYDRLESRFQALYHDHQERYGQDPLLIEARETAAAAEELYLLAAYREALEILQQAIDLLEERQRVEETRR